jgi:integrase
MRRRRRFQKGSLKPKPIGGRRVWYAQWRDENGKKRTRVLGECSKMSESKAWFELTEILRPINEGTRNSSTTVYTFAQFVGNVFLPHARKGWKEDSTAKTSVQIIEDHLVKELGGEMLHAITRQKLQNLLDRKAPANSYSVVAHIRWFLNAIFKLAVSDGVATSNPAAELVVIERACKSGRDVRPLTEDEVLQYLDVLDLRERLIARLGIFEGMRPGEMLALQWKHLGEDQLLVEQRVYRGSINTPKNGKARDVGLSDGTIAELVAWRELARDPRPDSFVFPSERMTAPLSRDNVWRRSMRPRLKKIGLEWATFQVLRSTNASLGEKAKVSAKASADQRGHGIGVSLDVYTKADSNQKREVVNSIEKLVMKNRKSTLDEDRQAA